MIVRIVDQDHPHHGETGVLLGEVIQPPGSAVMVKVALENCRHGVDACFVTLEQVQRQAYERAERMAKKVRK